MTRKLPWLTGAATTTGPHTRSARTAAPRAKRQRLCIEPSSDIGDLAGTDLRRQISPKVRASPPPALEPPAESEMVDGFNNDDRFRMVEDEFLDAAKQFTQYLHAAEYHRLKKAARSLNAETISSISRPVTVRMPDETRRKVESVARSKKQSAALEGLLGKQNRGSGTGEESEDNGGAWLGTALHGLMESPRKSSSSLTKIAKVAVPTRAAAGFHKPKHEDLFDRPMSYSPQPMTGRQSGKKLASQKESTTESSDDDDDLDAPIQTREASKSHQILVSTNPGSAGGLINSRVMHLDLPEVSLRASTFESRNCETKKIPANVSTAARERIAKRMGQTKIRDRKQEEKKLDIIPMFLS